MQAESGWNTEGFINGRPAVIVMPLGCRALPDGTVRIVVAQDTPVHDDLPALLVLSVVVLPVYLSVLKPFRQHGRRLRGLEAGPENLLEFAFADSAGQF